MKSILGYFELISKS